MEWQPLPRLLSPKNYPFKFRLSTAITHIDLIRHGRVLTPNLFCAPATEPLSPAGWEQLAITTRHAQADVMISSPSRRCYEFAAYLAKARCWPLYQLAGFQEMNFGNWIGKTTEAIWQQDNSGLQTLWAAPLDFTAPGGEALVAFVQRVQDSWADVLSQYAGQRILVFTHGGVLRVLLANVLKIPYCNALGFDIDYGSAVRIRVYADGSSSVYGLGVKDLA